MYGDVSAKSSFACGCSACVCAVMVSSCAAYTLGRPYCPGCVMFLSGPSCRPQLNMITSGLSSAPPGNSSINSRQRTPYLGKQI